MTIGVGNTGVEARDAIAIAHIRFTRRVARIEAGAAATAVIGSVLRVVVAELLHTNAGWQPEATATRAVARSVLCTTGNIALFALSQRVTASRHQHARAGPGADVAEPTFQLRIGVGCITCASTHGTFQGAVLAGTHASPVAANAVGAEAGSALICTATGIAVGLLGHTSGTLAPIGTHAVDVGLAGIEAVGSGAVALVRLAVSGSAVQAVAGTGAKVRRIPNVVAAALGHTLGDGVPEPAGIRAVALTVEITGGGIGLGALALGIGAGRSGATEPGAIADPAEPALVLRVLIVRKVLAGTHKPGQGAVHAIIRA